jgi:alpha-tubulin suppressor-like RCC1 family protein
MGAGSMWTPSRVSAGSDHTCAVDTNGRLRCWGRNGSGELGDGSFNDHPQPVAVNALTTTILDVSGGTDYTCAQTTSGARCWGNNYYGQLGDGTTATRPMPAVVTSLASTARPAAGVSHACALVAGEVHCWGNNALGQLGTGTFSVSLVPVEVDFGSAQ